MRESARVSSALYDVSAEKTVNSAAKRRRKGKRRMKGNGGSEHERVAD